MCWFILIPYNILIKLILVKLIVKIGSPLQLGSLIVGMGNGMNWTPLLGSPIPVGVTWPHLFSVNVSIIYFLYVAISCRPLQFFVGAPIYCKRA